MEKPAAEGGRKEFKGESDKRESRRRENKERGVGEMKEQGVLMHYYVVHLMY